jgi:hypothetical protein
MTKADLIRRVRRRSKQRPLRSKVENNPLAAGGATITVPDAHFSRFHIGQELNFDDGTDELAVITTLTEPDQVGVDRGQDGTDDVSHALDTGLILKPLWTNAEILDELTDVVENQLWPWVWVPKETTLVYDDDGHYSPAVTDIESITFVYQLVVGERYELSHEWLSPQQADDTNFPNGMLLIPETYDESTIYVAYRAQASLVVDGSGDFTNLPSVLASLTVVGSVASLVLAGEASLVMPDEKALERRIDPGMRSTAGRRLREEFENRRDMERINLQEDEEERVGTWVGVV